MVFYRKRYFKFLLIILLLFILLLHFLSIFGFCATSESGVLNYDSTKFINGSVISVNEQSGRGIAYYYCSSPGTLTVTNGYSNARYYFVTSSIDIGTSLSNGGNLSAGQSITLTINTPGYFIINAGSGSQSYTYEFNLKSGINSAVGDLVNGLSSTNIWSVFASSISFVSVSILVGLGFWFVVRLVDGMSRK